MLSATGLSRGVAVSLSGLSAILGWVIGGLLPIATSAVLLGASGNVRLAIIGIFLSGFASGAEMDAIAYLAGHSFGLRRFCLLFGRLSCLLALSIGRGPTLATFVFDTVHSYEVVIWAIIPLSALTSLMFLTVPPYPTFDKAAEDDDHA